MELPLLSSYLTRRGIIMLKGKGSSNVQRCSFFCFAAWRVSLTGDGHILLISKEVAEHVKQSPAALTVTAGARRRTLAVVATPWIG